MSEYPVDWRAVRLADAGRWLSGGTPNTSFAAYWNGDTPWISAASLKEFDITTSDRRVSQLGASSGTRTVPQGTVLLVVRGMSLKSEFRVGITQREVTFGQDCKAIITGPDIAPRFLAYSLTANADRVLALVDEAGHGTGRLPTDQLQALAIGVPTLAEQNRIVEILDSVNESIRTAERLIAKIEVAREAAIEDRLASLGVGTVSQRTLDSVCQKITDGTHQAVQTVVGDLAAIPFLYVSCIRDGRINWSESGFVTRSDYQIISRGREPAVGMVLYTAVGSYGHAAALSNHREFAFQRHIACVYPDPRLVSSEFLALWLNGNQMRRHADRVALGNAQKTVTLGSLSKFPFPSVPVELQVEIVSIYSSYSRRLETEYARAEKLKALRKGVLQDLLTGRVRVDAERVP